MEDHVLLYEPHTALFVEDSNALIFYEKIAEFGSIHLADNGSIYVEINQSLGAETENIFSEKGYKTELR
ncbi:hypothetical protein ACSTKZ_25220, partial [Vibrio parahaemolyticus]